ncbi:MAG: alpha/beta fold hydrolase [Saprospiraceae bacterium]|nr:alpha/beta fold hydrolase [Saprospiraceae bacterium]
MKELPSISDCRQVFHIRVVQIVGTFMLLVLLCGVKLTAQISKPDPIQFNVTSEASRVQIGSEPEWEQLRWRLKKNMEAVMGPLPDRAVMNRLEVKVLDTMNEANYQRYTLRILADKEEWIPAYLYMPKRIGIDGKLPAMLALHPTGAIGKDIVDGQGRPNRGYGRELAERGYVVIAPDYPSFGDLKDHDFATDAYESASMAAIFYHMRCVDFLSGHANVDPDRIGVIGHSLGGHNALFLAAFDERVKVVVTSCGWTQFEHYDIGPSGIERYGGRLGPWAQDRYMPRIREKYQLNGDLIPFNFHEVLALIAPRACFTNAPRNDANFSMQGVVEGISKAKPVYQFLNADVQLQVRHPEAEHDFPTEVRGESYEFIDQHLDHVPSQHTIE